MARFDFLPREAVWHFCGLLSCGGNISKNVLIYPVKSILCLGLKDSDL
jgi:hypothetical protein